MNTLALCHSKWITKGRGSIAKDLDGGKNCFTTKDLSASEGQAGRKNTKEEEDKGLDLAW